MVALEAVGCLALLRHAGLTGSASLPMSSASSREHSSDNMQLADERRERFRLWVKAHPLATRMILWLVLLIAILGLAKMAYDVSHGKRIRAAIIAAILSSRVGFRVWKAAKAQANSVNGASPEADKEG
jgi:hypothetical protein